jgi:xanthine dehydrogenase molybdopterin-binding subunit B
VATQPEADCQGASPLKGSTECGQQEQFYLEGHITYAVPREDGQLTLYRRRPSTLMATSAKPLPR